MYEAPSPVAGIPLLAASSARFPLVVLSALATIAAGCKARDFGEPGRSAIRQSDSVPVVGAPVSDDPAFQRDGLPPRLVGQNLVLFVGRSSWALVPDPDAIGVPSTRFDHDGFALLPATTSTPALVTFKDGEPIPPSLLAMRTTQDVREFEKRLSPRPAPFGAATLLEVMRANRKQFSRVIEGGSVQEPPLLGMRKAMEAAAKGQGVPLDTDLQSTFAISDPSRPFTRTWCATVPANYLSDIRYHYTCQVPAIFRGCYRYTVGLHFDARAEAIHAEVAAGKLSPEAAVSALRQAGAEDHANSVAYCRKGGDKAKIPAKTREPYAKYVEDDTRVPVSFYRDAFEAFYLSQERTLPGGGKVNVFDYVMTSAVFDFDYARQQDVLNASYGDLKPRKDPAGADARPFDPADPTDCKTYREPRPLTDVTDGTHCLATTPKRTAFYSNGR